MSVFPAAAAAQLVQGNGTEKKREDGERERRRGEVILKRKSMLLPGRSPPRSRSPPPPLYPAGRGSLLARSVHLVSVSRYITGRCRLGASRPPPLCRPPHVDVHRLLFLLCRHAIIAERARGIARVRPEGRRKGIHSMQKSSNMDGNESLSDCEQWGGKAKSLALTWQ